jgi:hypothetical protein
MSDGCLEFKANVISSQTFKSRASNSNFQPSLNHPTNIFGPRDELHCSLPSSPHSRHLDSPSNLDKMEDADLDQVRYLHPRTRSQTFN